MSSPAFANAIAFVLRWEGGYVNHPNDPGGATNKGVTQKVYDTWRARQGQAPQGVAQITDDEVHAIYEASYWQASKCQLLASPLDLVQFDTAVNMGVGRSVRFLQKAVGAEPDGNFGPVKPATWAACQTSAKKPSTKCTERLPVKPWSAAKPLPLQPRSPPKMKYGRGPGHCWSPCAASRRPRS